MWLNDGAWLNDGVLEFLSLIKCFDCTLQSLRIVVVVIIFTSYSVGGGGEGDVDWVAVFDTQFM